MGGEARARWGAKLAFAAGLLLLFTGTALSQKGQPTQGKGSSSSCITCHLNAELLQETAAAGAEPAKSPLQAGAG